jgi:hypothetical protein
MDQPLDLSVANNDLIKTKKFTIEYLTSNIYQPLLNTKNKSIPLLHPVENQLNNNKRFCPNSRLNEHVVPNICSPPSTVSEKSFISKTNFFFSFRNLRIQLWK